MPLRKHLLQVTIYVWVFIYACIYMRCLFFLVIMTDTLYILSPTSHPPAHHLIHQLII